MATEPSEEPERRWRLGDVDGEQLLEFHAPTGCVARVAPDVLIRAPAGVIQQIRDAGATSDDVDSLMLCRDHLMAARGWERLIAIMAGRE